MKRANKFLPDRESNPGLPRDRRRSSPLDYRGLDKIHELVWCLPHVNSEQAAKKCTFDLSRTRTCNLRLRRQTRIHCAMRPLPSTTTIVTIIIMICVDLSFEKILIVLLKLYSMIQWLRGATVARLTPDQKAACSNHVGVRHFRLGDFQIHPICDKFISVSAISYETIKTLWILSLKSRSREKKLKTVLKYFPLPGIKPGPAGWEPAILTPRP